MCKVETYAASASNLSGSVRSGLHPNKLTSPLPQGPMAQGHLMTTETQDVGLILSQALRMNMHEVPSYYSFPCEQYHAGVTNWINSIWEMSNIPACNKPTRIHCKIGG